MKRRLRTGKNKKYESGRRENSRQNCVSHGTFHVMSSLAPLTQTMIEKAVCVLALVKQA